MNVWPSGKAERAGVARDRRTAIGWPQRLRLLQDGTAGAAA